MFRFMIEFEIGKKKTSFKHDAKKQKERIGKAGNLINKKIREIEFNLSPLLIRLRQWLRLQYKWT